MSWYFLILAAVLTWSWNTGRSQVKMTGKKEVAFVGIAMSGAGRLERIHSWELSQDGMTIQIDKDSGTGGD